MKTAARRASARRKAGRMENRGREGLLIISLIDEYVASEAGRKIYLHHWHMYVGEPVGNITLSLKPEAEKLLRALAEFKYKSRKGSMAKVIEEAVQEVALNEKRKAAMESILKRAKKGWHLGIKNYRREMAYGRGPLSD